MNPKDYLFFFVLVLFSSTAIAQNEENINSALSGLADENKREEAFISFQGWVADPEQLMPFSSELSAVFNNMVESASSEGDFYYTLLLLESAGCIQINIESEALLAAQLTVLRKSVRQSVDYHLWIWEDEEYQAKRYSIGVLLDLFGALETEYTLAELQLSANYFIDNKLSMFAWLSLLERGEKINNEVFLSIAKDDESRGYLFEELTKLGKVKFFPKSFANQEALSKSDMVTWLLHPNEFGQMPDDIELVKTYGVRYSDVGKVDFYLWKFKVNTGAWKKDGWLVGLSGPFVLKESPSTSAYGYTFSNFEKLTDRTPENHIKDIISTVDEWYEEIE